MSKIYAWASAENIWKSRPSIYFRLPGTPYAYDKKTPNFDQGLDFSRFWKGKLTKTEKHTKQQLGTSES